MTRFSPLVADAGALAACASTQPVSTSPPPIWTTPEWKAEPAARKEQSAALLKKWNYCAIDQARDRALTDLPALVAVARAFESYKGEGRNGFSPRFRPASRVTWPKMSRYVPRTILSH